MPESQGDAVRVTVEDFCHLYTRTKWGADLDSRVEWKYERPRRQGDLFSAHRSKGGKVIVVIHVSPFTMPVSEVKPVLREACRAAYQITHEITRARRIFE